MSKKCQCVPCKICNQHQIIQWTPINVEQDSDENTCGMSKNYKKFQEQEILCQISYIQRQRSLPTFTWSPSKSEQMNLVKIKENNFHHITSVVIYDFKEVIDNKLCELPGVATLQLKLDAVPVVMSNRRIPVAVCPQMNEEFSRLTKISVI